MTRDFVLGRKDRPLRFESLEDRRLLSVSAAEYVALRESYIDFDLPEEMAEINIAEIDVTNLSVSHLQAAVNTARSSSQDDLIILRTTKNAYTMTFADQNDEFVIDFDVATDGRLTILAMGDTPLVIDAAEYNRVFRVISGSVQLGNLTLASGRVSTDIQGNSSSCAVGGGIAIGSDATVTLDRVSVRDCAASGVFDDSNFGFCSKGGEFTTPAHFRFFALRFPAIRPIPATQTVTNRPLLGRGGEFSTISPERCWSKTRRFVTI